MRDAEALAKGTHALRPQGAPKRRSADLAALEEQLRGALGTKVDLTQGRSGGRVVIHFYSDEELEAIIERLS